MPFVQRAIVPRASLVGIVSQFAHRTLYLPVPVDLARIVPQAWEQRTIDVLWAGREDANKNAEMAEAILTPLAGLRLRCAMYASHLAADRVLRLRDAGVDVVLGADMAVCHRAIGCAKVVLSTSSSECYATVLVEGMAGGAVPVHPEWLPLDHLEPFALTGRNVGQLLDACFEGVRFGGDTFGPRKMVGRAKFDARSICGKRWVRWLDDEMSLEG